MSSIQISVIDPTTEKITSLEIESNEIVENVKALVEVEFGIPIKEQVLRFNNQNLKDQDAINVIMVFRKAPVVSTNPIVQEAQQIKQYYEANPDQLQFILHQNPDLANAVLSDNINDLVKMVQQQKQKQMQSKIAEMQRIQQLEADPLNPDLQRQIEEEINQKNVQENLEFAQEYVPENFGAITMLYIEITVNKHPIQAFVDSGAQSTIMSQQCAERCGIMRLVDKRYAGMALGVGTQKIIGRIHIKQFAIKLIEKIFPCAITVLQGDGIDFLFGLDMLKRYQCSIDLSRNKLVFPSAQIEVRFLSEGEIHKSISIDQEKQLLEQSEKKEQPKQQEKISQQPQQTQTQPKQSQQQQQSNQNTQQQKKSTKSNQNEEKIQQLVNMGFQRNLAIQALQATNGNLDMAAALLTQQQYGF